MRASLLGALVVVVGAAGFLLLRDSDTDCTSSSTVYDGNVLPGGPVTAEEALAGFLSVAPEDPGTGEPMPDDPSAYQRRATPNGGVTFSSGHLTLSASEQSNGWMIGSASTSC